MMYLIAEEWHQHAAVWIKAMDADAQRMDQYNQQCMDLFYGVKMADFPHFVTFGSDLDFEAMPQDRKYAMQRVLVVLATHHLALTFCPMLVHLVEALMLKMDVK